MAESYSDPNLLAWQRSNAESSGEGFRQHSQELKDKRLNYEKLLEQRKTVIGVAEGLASEYGPQGDKAPSYIHKFLKKAESSGGVGQLATDEINKFLMTHKTVQDETAFKQKIDNEKASAEAHRAQAAQAVYNVAAAKKAETEAEAMRQFLLEAQGADVKPPTVTKDVEYAVGVKNVNALGNKVEEFDLVNMGIDPWTGEIFDKDTFKWAASVDAKQLAERFGLPLNAEKVAATEQHISSVRKSFMDKLGGLAPELVFDVGGERKVDDTGKRQPSPAENAKALYARLVRGDTALGLVPHELTPANYSAVREKAWSVTAEEQKKLQGWVKKRLLELGFNEEATIAELTHNLSTEEHEKDKLALSFEAVKLTKKVEVEVEDASLLAKMRYQKAVARWKEKGLTPPIPEQAYIASVVPQTVRNVPNFGPDGKPDGTYKTYFNQGTGDKPNWVDATTKTEAKTMTDSEAQLKEIKNANQVRARTVKGQFGDIIVDGVVTRESDNEGKSVADLWAALTPIQTFNDHIDALIELQENVGPVGLLGVNMTAARLYNVRATLAQALARKDLIGQGAVTEDDQKRLNQLVQNPDIWQTWFSSSANIAALKQLKRVLMDKAAVQLEISGVARADGTKGWTFGESKKNAKAKAIELLRARQGGANLTPEQQRIIEEYQQSE